MPIGGFFGLETAVGAPVGASVLERWTEQTSGWIGFHNARSAFAYLVRAVTPGTVWLPRYLCLDMEIPAARLRYYGRGVQTNRDVAALENGLAAGDLVLSVAYFGAPVGPALRRLAASRPDVCWVEDRAQALMVPPDLAVPGAWRLYSPRKLLGVGDGGVLVGPVDRLSPPALSPPPTSHLAAAEARAKAQSAEDVAAAYRLYVAIEREHATADTAMADGTRGILSGTAIEPLAARRRENFTVLDALLAAHAHPIAGDLRQAPAPFGYPLLIARDRDAVAARLAADGFFCAVHWRDLVAGAQDSPEAQTLSRQMLTLPVDHRYGPDDMTRLAKRVLRELE